MSDRQPDPKSDPIDPRPTQASSGDARDADDERDERDEGAPSVRTIDPGRDAERRARLLAARDILAEAADDRALLAVLDEEERRSLLMAAGRVSRPDRHEIRDLLKEIRRRERAETRRADEEVLDATGIRSLRRAPVFATPKTLAVPPPPLALATDTRAASTRLEDATSAATSSEGASASPSEATTGAASTGAASTGEADRPRTLNEARKCYVCKASFREVHAFYDQMCPSCAELNWQKRNATADLRGRVALVTGARVKIGYHAAIKLLRAGAHTIVSTRFPRDAALRFAREEDFEDWKDRLEIFGLDLRHTPSVEAFCAHLLRTHSRLDFLINNACQTVRRPPGFYRHLMTAESSSLGELPAHARPWLESYEALRHQRALEGHEHASHGGPGAAGAALAAQAAGDVGLVASAALSQLALTDEDRRDEVHFFPDGKLDQDLQQVDLRGRNSWRLALAEVPTVELLEVQLVNAVAPFVLDARLKPLMLAVPTRDKHIVNVSAMEGQFYREHKTDRHPHTNMAKAALNMLTRTSAADYVADGIHMNSVDTGWITDEDPAEIAVRKVEEHGFHPPLDVVDGAARIVDPVFHGINTGEHHWGLFLKDYRPIPW